MKKMMLVVLALAASFALFGCGKKQQALEDMQEPMSIEALATTSVQAQAGIPETKPEAVSQAQVQTAAQPQLEAMPPSGPYKPTTEEIQKALKAAGFYSGNIDGKKGPMTKKAVEDFQKANNLQADGKVGPKTWEVLGKFLNIAETPSNAKSSR